MDKIFSEKQKQYCMLCEFLDENKFKKEVELSPSEIELLKSNMKHCIDLDEESTAFDLVKREKNLLKKLETLEASSDAEPS